MTVSAQKVKVLGHRVQVKKERVDIGGLVGTPGLEEDGMKNTGVIIGVGQVGILARLRGVCKGKTIYFKKFFIPNADRPDVGVFVNLEDIVAISNK